MIAKPITLEAALGQSHDAALDGTTFFLEPITKQRTPYD
jgi:hypothetical protein